MSEDIPEDKIICEVANTQIDYYDFRQKHYFGDSAMRKLVTTGYLERNFWR